MLFKNIFIAGLGISLWGKAKNVYIRKDDFVIAVFTDLDAL